MSHLNALLAELIGNGNAQVENTELEQEMGEELVAQPMTEILVEGQVAHFKKALDEIDANTRIVFVPLNGKGRAMKPSTIRKYLNQYGAKAVCVTGAVWKKHENGKIVRDDNGKAVLESEAVWLKDKQGRTVRQWGDKMIVVNYPKYVEGQPIVRRSIELADL